MKGTGASSEELGALRSNNGEHVLGMSFSAIFRASRLVSIVGCVSCTFVSVFLAAVLGLSKL